MDKDKILSSSHLNLKWKPDLDGTTRNPKLIARFPRLHVIWHRYNVLFVFGFLFTGYNVAVYRFMFSETGNMLFGDAPRPIHGEIMAYKAYLKETYKPDETSASVVKQETKRMLWGIGNLGMKVFDIFIGSGFK